MDNKKTTTYLAGKVELAIGAMVIGPEFLGEMTVEFTEGTRTVSSLAGNITNPSGMMDTAQVTGTFIIPSMDALKQIFQGAYEAPSEEGLAGRVVFGGGTCKALEGLPINIHPVCEADSNNDVHIYSGMVSASLSLTYNQSDMLTAQFTIYAQPTEDGYGFAGAGDLTQKTLYDATTQTFKPITPASED